MFVAIASGRAACRWKVIGFLERRRNAKRARLLIQALETMSNHHLRDIGLSRDGIRHASRHGGPWR